MGLHSQKSLTKTVLIIDTEEIILFDNSSLSYHDNRKMLIFNKWYTKNESYL